MAFICSLGEDPYQIDAFEQENARLISCPIGHDSDCDINYALLIGLEPAPGWEFEFFFCLMRINGYDCTEDPIWNSAEVSLLIDRTDRAKIRELLFSASAHLINSAQPSHFFMATRDANLPCRALSKYGRLCRIFANGGYMVGQADPYHGRHMWCMERTSN